jgi:hypothetical protein
VLSDRAKRQQRRAELLGVRSQGNFLFRVLHEGMLRANYLFTDHTRNALILAVFGFRVSCQCQWPSPAAACRSSATERLGIHVLLASMQSY